MKLKIHEFDMELKYPFSISRHTYYSQPNTVIELIQDGFTGYGEATINPYYQITIENLRSTFSEISGLIKEYEFSTPDKLFEDFKHFLDVNSFALAALNNASWDLYGKMMHLPVWKLLDSNPDNLPLTSYTLGIASREEMSKKIDDLPWPIYKVKLGTHEDLKIVEHLRKIADSTIRVDANCAWNARETIDFSKILNKLNVEFIEQPLPALHPDQSICFEQSQLPLVADESCCKESDVPKCAGLFHGVNIKLLKCGGLSPAVRMIKEAKKLGLKIMVGCMTESSIGISAASQLLPFVDYADLDGPLLLKKDLATGIAYDYGKIALSENHGLGIDFVG